jgi:small subunit ribosomal protein S27Ae
MKKIEFFKVEGDRINRIRKHCPKCGLAVFLADHKNRFSCGKCGYTEFKGGSNKEPQPPKIEEKPIELPVQEQEKPEVALVRPKEEIKDEISDTEPITPIEKPLTEEKPSEEPPKEEEEVKPEEHPKEEPSEPEQKTYEEELKEEKTEEHKEKEEKPRRKVIPEPESSESR